MDILVVGKIVVFKDLVVVVGRDWFGNGIIGLCSSIRSVGRGGFKGSG